MATKMRPFRGTIPLDDARRIIAGAVRPIDHVEQVPLLEAAGRILARAVAAPMDVPPFSRAGMDGYAVRASDTIAAGRSHPRQLRRVEQLFTGQVATRPLGPGECIEIATGAPMPDGADAVVIVEETDAGDDLVRVYAAVQPGQNVGPQGSDIKAGTIVLEPGTLLNPSRVGAIAATGEIAVAVFARPRVSVLSTGNEIVDPGVPLGPGQIYDVNRFTIAGVVEEHGGIAVPHRSAADTIDALSRAVDECLADDVLVFSGGSSVGERDLILDILSSRGTVLFHGISVKPGKPTAFGLVEGKPFFGMPGYPASCLTNAYVLLAPALRQIARLPPVAARTITVPLSQRVSSAAGRHQFYTVRVENGMAVPAFKASGDITSMSRADGYIEIAAETDFVERGTRVMVTLF